MSRRVAVEQQMKWSFDDDEVKVGVEESPEYDASSTFLASMSLPIHRWFRYSAGFSASWTREVIERQKLLGRRRVLDPFAGSGTVMLEAELCGVEAAGIEAHPFVARVAMTKLLWRENPHAFREYALAVLGQAMGERPEIASYPPLIAKCYPPETLARLDRLRRAWQGLADGSPLSELTWLCLASILREASPVGTAQWQYILPNKSKARAADPFEAFESKLRLMVEDMRVRQQLPHGPASKIYQEDARGCRSIADGWADLVITSPPYANNYDYADATRLEMSFFGEIRGWGDLQDAVRQHLVRSCTQHVAKIVDGTYAVVADPLLKPIRPELQDACVRLEAERVNHGGKKPYHTMIANYFYDLAQVWVALRRVTSPGRSLVCFVVGDSAPYSVYVPVEEWLGKLALAAGFARYTFEVTRERNVKWKNRKHRVPLHEGRLWVEG